MVFRVLQALLDIPAHGFMYKMTKFCLVVCYYMLSKFVFYSIEQTKYKTYSTHPHRLDTISQRTTLALLIAKHKIPPPNTKFSPLAHQNWLGLNCWKVT